MWAWWTSGGMVGARWVSEYAAPDARTQQARAPPQRCHRRGTGGGGEACCHPALPLRRQHTHADAAGKEHRRVEAPETLHQVGEHQRLIEGAPERPGVVLEDCQAVRGCPGPRGCPPGAELRRGGLLARSDACQPRVYARRIGLEQLPVRGGQHGEIGRREVSEAEHPGAPVCFEGLLAHQLRHATERLAAQPHHLRQAVLGMDEAQRQVGVCLAPCGNVGHTPSIAQHLDGCLEPCGLYPSAAHRLRDATSAPLTE